MWDRYADIALCLLAGIAFFFPLHVILWRRNPSSLPRILFLKFLMALGVVVSAALFIFLRGFDANGLFLLVSAAMCIDMGYIYLYSAVCRSVSLTVLIRVLDAGIPLALDDIISEYTRSKRFDERVRIMAEMGLFSVNGETVAITEKGAKAARRVRAIAVLVAGRLSG